MDFYICHPTDWFFNAINQHYWLEYHPTSDVTRPDHQSTAHLIRPFSQSEDYAIAEGLTPFRQWVRLINVDTFYPAYSIFLRLTAASLVIVSRWRNVLRSLSTLASFPTLSRP